MERNEEKVWGENKGKRNKEGKEKRKEDKVKTSPGFGMDIQLVKSVPLTTWP